MLLYQPLEQKNDAFQASGQAAKFLNFTLVFSMSSPKVLDEADDDSLL